MIPPVHMLHMHGRDLYNSQYVHALLDTQQERHAILYSETHDGKFMFFNVPTRFEWTLRQVSSALKRMSRKKSTALAQNRMVSAPDKFWFYLEKMSRMWTD
jgi:hypothetical protein